MARRKGESVLLQCTSCSWSTEVPIEATLESTVVSCTHCGAPIFWHRCAQCELCYVGEASPRCPSCDDPSLDELEFG